MESFGIKKNGSFRNFNNFFHGIRTNARPNFWAFLITTIVSFSDCSVAKLYKHPFFCGSSMAFYPHFLSFLLFAKRIFKMT
jgi:hypothetical protein